MNSHISKNIFISVINHYFYIFAAIMFRNVFAAKYIISTALMMENPVSRPMVPPTAESMSTNFILLSLVMRSNVGVSM